MINNNINYNQDLFSKVYNNIYLRNLILSYIKRPFKSGYDYNSTTSLSIMVENNKFEMILDKIKSNHFIYIDMESLNGLFSKLLNQQNQIERIFTPLIKKYSNRVQSLSPLESSIHSKCLDIFKYFLNYYNINPNNNNIQNNSINQSYLLYCLLEQSLKYSSIEISKYILDLIKSSNNIYGESINNNNNININNNQEDSKISNIINFNPNYFECYFYVLIDYLSREKFEFIRDDLGLDLELLIKKNKQDSENGKKVEVFSYSVYPSIDYLLLMNGFDVMISKDGYKDDDIIYAKIQLLKNAKFYNKDQFNQFTQFLNGNQDLKKWKLLISGIRDILSKNSSNISNRVFSSLDYEISPVEENLFLLFGPLLIYDYLKNEKHEKIYELAKNHYSEVIETVKEYSISKLSISAYNLFKYLLILDDHIKTKNWVIISFNNKVNNEKAKNYINYLMDDFNNQCNSQSVEHSDVFREEKNKFISQLIVSLIHNYHYEFIESVFNENEKFREYYKMVVINFSYKIEKVLDKRKIYIGRGTELKENESSIELTINNEDICESFSSTTISNNNSNGEEEKELITLKYNINTMVKDEDDQDTYIDNFIIDFCEKRYQRIEGIMELYKLLKQRRYNQALVYSKGCSTDQIRLIKIMDFFDHSISLEWFDKLFKPIIKPILDCTSYHATFDLLVDITFQRIDIY